MSLLFSCYSDCQSMPTSSSEATSPTSDQLLLILQDPNLAPRFLLHLPPHAVSFPALSP